MKPNPLSLMVAVLCSLLAFSNAASAQGTAFTYQGRLNADGSPATGSYDIAFSLYTANAGGVAIAGPVTNSAVGVTNGLFTTTLDFGSVFTGASNWLQIAVSTNGANAFSNLVPRQQLTPVPYAVYAESANAANLVGTIPAGNLSGAAFLAGGNAFTGNQTIQGAVGITGNNTLQFGAGLAGQQVDAGKIGYEVWTSDSLDIVGAGTNGTTRKIKFWAEGGAAFSGTLTANSFAGNGGGLTNVSVSAAQLTSIGNTGGGGGNFFVGPSGNATTSGHFNTANGLVALYNNTSGDYNTADGKGALYSNTSGSDNTALGYQALEVNTSGGGNTAVGMNALANNTIGSYNTSQGMEALWDNSSGSYNIALGYQAGANITGSSNIDIGNTGLSTDTNLIRIGSGQTATYLAGTIHGDALVTGKISSPMWGTTVQNFFGPLSYSNTNTFTCGGGTLVILTSGSGYSSSTGLWIGMQLIVDHTSVDGTVLLNNLANTHQAFPQMTTVLGGLTGIAAGTHALQLVPWDSHTTTDNKDYFKVTILELPF